MPLAPGLYEAILTEALAEQLQRLDRLTPSVEPLRAAEAADRLALHLGRVLQRTVAARPSKERVEYGVTLARARGPSCRNPQRC